jgi:hypothetical protein
MAALPGVGEPPRGAARPLRQRERQPDRRSRGWFGSIREQRRPIARLLKQTPSLRAKAADALADGFESGVDLVLRETDLPLRRAAGSTWTSSRPSQALIATSQRLTRL